MGKLTNVEEDLRETASLEIDLNIYLANIYRFSRQEIVNERKELFHAINGDVFYSLNAWPEWMKSVFWRKPLGDKMTFKLLCQMLGNGCSPLIICKWILTSLYGKEPMNRQKKRLTQMLWMIKNIPKNLHHWYYYDLFHQRFVYFDGDFKIFTNY